MFNPEEYINKKCIELKNNIKGKALIAVSGGVDSSVSAALLKRAKIDIKLIFIDTGYQRRNEPKMVVSQFRKMGYNIDLLKAKKYFYKNTFSKKTPEDKRLGFKNAYFDLIIKYAKDKKINNLVQGTQFSRLTTQIGHSTPNKRFLNSKIKLFKPVAGLTKDNIRAVAKRLGLPKNIVERMPFPGPGLLIRFSGKPTTNKINTTRQATAIIDNMLKTHMEIFKKSYQLFPFLLDVSIPYKSSDTKKANGSILLIRSLQQLNIKDGCVYVPFAIPKKVENKLVSDLFKIKCIARVCFDLSPKNGTGLKVRAGASIEYS